MSGGDEGDTAHKSHEPSQKRLEDARDKGDVPRSADLVTAASYAGFVLGCVTQGPSSMDSLAQLGATMLDQSDRLSMLATAAGSAPIGGMLGAVGLAVLPFFAFPAAAALVALVAQGSLTFTPEKLNFRLSRLSLLAGFKQKFGLEGLFGFARSTVKLVIVSLLLGAFLLSRLGEILQSAELAPAAATLILLDQALTFLFLVLLITLVVGAADFLWQRYRFLHRNRMSRQEVLDESRQSEGDPHMKSERRQRGQEIAMNRMLMDVPRADVVIVNPTHYAVALLWNRSKGGAPVCVAKGVDGVAARIREKAAAAGVPIHGDPPTARALFATIDIGQEVRPEHYRAVAAAIRFAEAMRKRAKGMR
ncbi:MAG: flagellar biosynthesis protein FlhB [Cereibacter sphaeroides]|uniref:Flagellar biosynthesis protein FlhB n=1 Tax=Cereibacter sphaeroides TaxID=1063 RepID=A0A2W5S9G3_CERSP|nr:MAG: flagellar biosynthesis protein FlhB [Cereibacter sphaeroides]